MDQDYKEIEQIYKALDRRMAKFDTPEKIEFMQNEIEQAILALSNLFGLMAQESIDMPEFVFCNFYDGYSLLHNEISMDPEGITPYRMGFVSGEFLYSKVNPATFLLRDFFSKAYIRTLGKSDPSPTKNQDYALANACINLITAIGHYCGLYLNRDGCFESEDSSDLLKILFSLPEDSAEYHLASIRFNAHYKGMVIAENLFSQYSAEMFESILRLEFEEARLRLFYMTGIDLFAEINISADDYKR